ncbi:hypothetical protein STENM327S_05953 [Streptomyces tendae]
MEHDATARLGGALVRRAVNFGACRTRRRRNRGPHRARARPRGRPAQAGSDRGDHGPGHGTRPGDPPGARAGLRAGADPGRTAAAQAHPRVDHRPGPAARHHQGDRADPGAHQGGCRGRLRRLRGAARLPRGQAARCADRRPRGQRPTRTGQQDRLALRRPGRRLHSRQQAAQLPLHRHPAAPLRRHPRPRRRASRGPRDVRARPQPADAAGLRRLAGRPAPQRGGAAGRALAPAGRHPDPARGRPRRTNCRRSTRCRECPRTSR